MKRFFVPALVNNRRRSLARRPALRIEQLEVRQMMTADPLANLEPVSYLDEFAAGANPYPAIVETIDVDGLPMFHSNPGASKSLYLNFRGATIANDFQTDHGNIKGEAILAFDFGGDRAVFDADEQGMIRQIFQMVAEDFAPFDIDVTTEYPGPIAKGLTQHVVIGDWDADDTATGLGYRNSFNLDMQAPALVLSSNVQHAMALLSLRDALGDDDFRASDAEIDAERPNVLGDSMHAIGNGVSHEAGHAFGLQHDRALDAEYDKGTEDWTPIMGWTLDADRMTWSHPMVEPAWIDGHLQDQYEDELAILTKSIGARADDHGDVDAFARPMADVNAGIRFEAAGIISTMNDVDVFSFMAPRSGKYAIDVNVPAYANLDVAVDWYGPGSPTLDGPELALHTAVWLEEGAEYFLRVRSHGQYGDLGHYTAAVTWDLSEIGPMPEMLDIPYIPELDLIDPNPDVWTNPDYVDAPQSWEPWSADDVPPLVDPVDGAFDDYAAIDPIFDEPIQEDYEALSPTDNYWNWDLALTTITASQSIRAKSLRRF